MVELLEYYLEYYGEVIIQIILCVFLTGLVGYNREKNATPIGLRTHILVGLSAVIIQITALRYANEGGYTDHMRLAGQFISGIAFLGTGTIMKEKGYIRGLTTASSIFFAACIGITIGTGLYIEAVLVTLVVYALLSDIMGIKQLLRTTGTRTITLSIEVTGKCKKCEQIILEKLEQMGISIIEIEMRTIALEQSKVVLRISVKEDISINEIMLGIMEIETVLKVEFLQG